MFSQHNDEAIIKGFFGSFTGHFLDIGAFDGEKMSNTRALALMGWSGLVVEPSPWVFPKLYQRYRDTGVAVLNAAVSSRSGLVPIWPDLTNNEYGSTLSGEWAAKSHVTGSSPYWVHAIGINELLAQRFDFVTIDAEGHDTEIIIAGVWHGVKLLCFEHSTNPPNLKDALNILGLQGFAEYARTPTNVYLCGRERESIKKP